MMSRFSRLWCACSVTAALMAVPALAAQEPGTEAGAEVQTVEIVLSNFQFSPSEFHLKAGTPYRLHFVNKGSGGHNFSAKALFAAAVIAPEDRNAISDGKIELAAGEARDVRLIPAAGTYKAKCTHFLHKSFGMTGSVVVN